MLRPLVLVVEDNEITAKMMRVALESANYRAIVATTALSALDLVAQEKPDIILQDLLLPDLDGVELLARIRQIPEASDVPVVVCSGLLSKIEEARNAHSSFTDYLFKPVDVNELIQTVRRLLPDHAARGAESGKSRRVILVDDDPVQLKLNALQLRAAGFEVQTTDSPAEAIRIAEQAAPDAFLFDLLMPDMSGLELCALVRHHPTLALTPVVVASATFGAFDNQDTTLATRMGANALVARTPTLDLIIDALIAAVQGNSVPAVASDVAELHDQFSARIGVQLEREVALNSSLSRRIALDTALLAAARGAAAMVNDQRELDDVIRDVLTHTLDAGGVSSGAVYLCEKDASLKLCAWLGFGAEVGEALTTFFGHANLLQIVIRSREPLRLGKQEFSDHAAADLPERSGMPALLLEPLVARGEVVGVLVVGASRFESMREWMDTVHSIGGQLAQAISHSRTLDELKASEENFRSFFEGLPIASYRSLPDGTLLDVNSEFLTLCGFDKTIPLNEISWNSLVVNQEDLQLWRKKFETNDVLRNFETQLLRGDGTRVWISVTMRVIRDLNGEVVRFEGGLTDITQRKEAQAKLAHSETYFRQLFESNPFPMLVIEPASLQVLSTNTAARIFFERSPAQFQGMSIDRLIDNFHESPELLSHILVDGDLSGDARLARFRRKSGDYAEMELTSRSVRYAGVAARMLIVHDVTDRELLQQQVLQAQKMEAMGLLAGGVAHDFNNLLTVMKSCASTLLEDLPEGDLRREDALEIVTAAERATVLTRQLLAFSRKQVLDTKPLAVNNAVSDLERMLRRLISATIEFEIDLDPAAGQILVDAGQFEQVVVNLVVNARDAMPRGGSLRISTTRADDAELANAHLPVKENTEYVKLVISDSGLGMDEATRSRIFEPFFTTKPRGQGTGLGLSTVHGIVLQSSGFVRVVTALNKGTSFEIFFPRIATPTLAARPVAPVVASRGHERILVVEDEEAVRRIVCRTFSSAGYTVLEARNGEEALTLADTMNAAPDLLISDVVMPRLNGFDLVIRLKQTWPDLRVLFMSGYSDIPAEQSEAMKKFAFIQKPFLPAELSARVREILDRSR